MRKRIEKKRTMNNESMHLPIVLINSPERTKDIDRTKANSPKSNRLLNTSMQRTITGKPNIASIEKQRSTALGMSNAFR